MEYCGTSSGGQATAAPWISELGWEVDASVKPEISNSTYAFDFCWTSLEESFKDEL